MAVSSQTALNPGEEESPKQTELTEQTEIFRLVPVYFR